MRIPRISPVVKQLIFIISILPVVSFSSVWAGNWDLNLTQEEQAWLKVHPVIRIAPDPDFAPFEWFSLDGNYKGMAADYIRLVETKLGIKFQTIHVKDWSKVMDMARDQEVDVLPAAARSPQREEYLLFTKPHIIVPGVIISAKDYKTIDELKGRKVAVVTDYVWDDLITYNKVDVSRYRVDDTKAGLELTSMGAVDAMVSDLASATTIIREEGFTNLRIVGYLDRKLDLGFAIRNDWPELQSILEKAVESISTAEREAITARWIKFEEPSFWRNPVFWYSTLAGLSIFLLILAGFIIWNRTLKQQVELRTQALKDAQMQLIQAEKMESVGRLAAGVAHEVKNPLAIIQMGTDYLSQEVNKDETTGEVIKDIDDAVRRADSVIRGLLDFSRDKKLELKPGSINEILESSLHLVGYEMRQRSIKVISSLTEDVPEIELDANKLQQVFINLFMNSAHAMERDGNLMVTSYIKTLSNKADLACDHENRFKLGEQVLWVEVEDTGTGIKEKDRAKIFDPFYTTKPVGEGTGLGLSVSRNIISLHQGSIDIRNRPEGGASVVIMFKLKQGDSQ